MDFEDISKNNIKIYIIYFIMENYIVSKCDNLMSQITYSKTTKFAVTWIAVHGLTDILNHESSFIVIYVYIVSIMVIYFLNICQR